MKSILEVRNIKKYFWTKKGLLGLAKDPVKAVDDVSFDVSEGQTFGLVGESGSGKSTLARLIVGIYKPDSGSVSIKGERAIVFQDPFSSLNPRMTIREIVGEPLVVRGVKKSEVCSKVEEALRLVKLNAIECMNKYPHEFSGGERQRIAIARSLIAHPEVIVLDEPVSSLDVIIQASILNLLKDLQEELNLTYIFISHDLRVVEFMSDFVGVMKEGKLVEIASKDAIYAAPRHEYTKKLLESIPKLEYDLK